MMESKKKESRSYAFGFFYLALFPGFYEYQTIFT